MFSEQVLCHSRPLTAQLDGSAPVHVCDQGLWSNLGEGEVEQSKYLISAVSNANTCPLWCLPSQGLDLVGTLEATQLPTDSGRAGLRDAEFTLACEEVISVKPKLSLGEP